VGAISPWMVMTMEAILALWPGADQAPMLYAKSWASFSAAVKGRGPTKQVRATLAFRQRQFVASSTGRLILTLIIFVDRITGCYYGVQPYLRASLPPSRSRAHPTYEASRA
jgi:hypothetical protein